MVRAWLWRFGTLPYARSVFAGAPVPWVLSRRFAGGRLALDLSRSDTHRLLFLEGERFVEERGLLRSLARSGDTVIDVGANIGYITLLLTRNVGPRGRVVCLEPIPANLVELQRNARLNADRRIEILAVAAGDRDGTVNMSSGINGVVTEGPSDVTVEIRRLDSIGLPRVDLVKIDVEGFEAAVVRGMDRLLSASRPRLFLELHPGLVGDLGDLRGILSGLESRGYVVEAARPARSKSILRLAGARYLGAGALERSREPRAWLDEAERGGRSDPFWVVASQQPEARA